MNVYYSLKAPTQATKDVQLLHNMMALILGDNKQKTSVINLKPYGSGLR